MPADDDKPTAEGSAGPPPTARTAQAPRSSQAVCITHTSVRPACVQHAARTPDCTVGAPLAPKASPLPATACACTPPNIGTGEPRRPLPGCSLRPRALASYPTACASEGLVETGLGVETPARPPWPHPAVARSEADAGREAVRWAAVAGRAMRRRLARRENVHHSCP